MRKCISLVWIVFYFQQIHAQEFSNTGFEFKGADGGSAIWCDFNNDGLLDFFVTGYKISDNDFTYATFYAQKEDNTFEDSRISTIPRVIYSQQAFGDFDNDGDIDLLLEGTTSGFYEDNLTELYINDHGNFTKSEHIFNKISQGTVKWIDFDNDGDLDLFLVGYDTMGNCNPVLYENIDESFIDTQIKFELNTEFYFKWAEWVDLNNDGYLDLLMNRRSDDSNSICLYASNGNGVFTLMESIGIPFDDYRNISVGDYNNDGLADLLFWAYKNFTPSEMPVILFKNNGCFQFEEVWRENVEHFSGTIELIDMNYDGLSDIFIYCRNESSTLLYLNNGDDSFTLKEFSNLPQTLWFGKAYLADYNSDLKLDLLTIGTLTGSASDAFTYLYKNTDMIFNNQPSAPDSIYYEIDQNDVIIKWNHGSDIETPYEGLTYNLCFSSTFDECNIISCNSNMDGSRQVIDYGNTRNNFYRLKNIPEGIYYCKVQTIDNSLLASEFSETFELAIKYDVPHDSLFDPISIFPNPTSDYVQIELHQNITNIKYLLINDVNGYLMQKIDSPQENTININVTGYPKGIYYVLIVDENSSKTYRFLIN